MKERWTRYVLTKPRCGTCGTYINCLEIRTDPCTRAPLLINGISPGICPGCGVEFVRVDIDTEAHTCTALSKDKVEKMRIICREYAIITKDRPTEFLTHSRETSDVFDDAMRFGALDDAEDELVHLDEPGNFIIVPVTISVEV